MTDSGEDGLTWWANPNGGSGYMRIKRASDGAVIKSFNSDFGGQIYHQFTVGYLLNANTLEPVNEINLFPNPSTGLFNAEILLDKKQNVSVQIFDVTGQLVFESKLLDVVNKMLEINLSGQPGGIYSAHFIAGDKEWVKKIVLAK